MRKISIDNVEIGMKVEKPVINSKGIILLPQGADLNEFTIARLKKWNIEEIFVNGESASEIDELKLKIGQDITDESMIEIDKSVDLRFSNVKDNEIMQGIAIVAKLYLKNKKQNF